MQRDVGIANVRSSLLFLVGRVLASIVARIYEYHCMPKTWKRPENPTLLHSFNDI